MHSLFTVRRFYHTRCPILIRDSRFYHTRCPILIRDSRFYHTRCPILIRDSRFCLRSDDMEIGYISYNVHHNVTMIRGPLYTTGEVHCTRQQRSIVHDRRGPLYTTGEVHCTRQQRSILLFRHNDTVTIAIL